MGAPKGKGKGKGKIASDGKGKGKGKSPSVKGTGKGKVTDSDKWVAIKGRCLVTGASGFVAGSLIKTLLANNYKVRGTVRSLSDEAKVGSLKKLFPGLELVEADLLGGEESFAKAMDGVSYVFHTASPFALSANDPQKEFVEPALKGTTAVVSAAIKAKVQRIVVTSSCAAVGPPQDWVEDGTKADPEKVFTEEDWNTSSTVERGGYRYSKRVAEEKAWELVKDVEGTSLVVICPSFVIGPMLTSRADATSIKFIKSMLDGTMQQAGAGGGFALGVVDVRDLAVAHMKAMEIPEAAGKRFICSSELGVGQLEACDFIRKDFKAYALPTTEKSPVVYKAKYSNARAKEVLKLRFRPPALSMKDMAHAAVRLGIVEKKFVLKTVKFGKVKDMNPDSKGLDLLLKVVSIGEAQDTKAGTKIFEVVAGDATGIVTLRLTGDEMAIGAKAGDIVEVRNGAVRMLKGHIQVQIGKWGKFAKHEGDVEITPGKKDVSATEYELVKA